MEDELDPVGGRLAQELPPPAALEERVVARLKAAGLLRSPRRWAARDLAAALAIFLLGLVGGAYLLPRSPEAPPRSPRFLLLLYAGAEGSLPPGAEGERAQEYRRWAAALRREGTSVTGERLAAEPWRTLGAAAPDSTALQGFFIVGAASLEEAARLAEGSPHVRYGGSVVVRAIDTP